MFISWLLRIAGTAAIILLYRYLLRLGTPRRDWWQVEEWALRARVALTRRVTSARFWWFTVRNWTDGQRAALRARLEHSEFGIEGT